MTFTPMVEQYLRIKAQAQDAILFFRMGDFFEIFGTDAETVAPILDLVLTSREKGDQTRIPFCGVPHHSAKQYWLKLLSLGFKVALAEQTEDPSQAKGIVRREIVRVLTPGTVDDLEGLQAECPSYLLCLHEDPKTRQWAAAVADVSTGELRVGHISGLAELPKLLSHFQPTEILVRTVYTAKAKDAASRYLLDNRLAVSDLPESALQSDKIERCGDEVAAMFRSSEIQASAANLVCVAGIITYLHSLKASSDGFVGLRHLWHAERMQLSETSVRDLEIFETSRKRHARGSLFGFLNRCATPMGARYLRASLQAPFCSEAKIAARLDLVEQLVTDRKVAMEIASTLRHMPDLSRLLGRLSTLSIKPGELGRMRQSLDAVANLAGVIANTSRPLASFSKQLQGVGKVRQILQQALVESPASLAESGDGIFIQGYDKEYDKLLSLKLDGGARITDYETKLKGETGIASLKIKEHKSYGLLIEVTKTNTKKVPTSFIRRQTMVNCERFVTEELRDLESKLTNAQAGAVQRESELWQKLLNTVKAHIETMSLAAELVAEIDCLANLALIAAEFNYVRPKTLKNTNAHRIHLTGARHPVVEMAVGRHAYVPNGFHLDSEVSAALITGPNMGGKSTFMRQTALIALLHQIGSFVPALSAELPIFDQIFTRIGAGDDLANNQSTFMVEMLEAAFILRNATASSLVILDEVGRGTSTTDGLAIAESILHDLLGRVGCTTLFATHFHELTDRFDQRVQRLQAEVIEKGQEIRFSHRIIPGSASRSFGIEVAKLAGIPTQVVKHAQRLAKGLEQAPLESLGLVAATDHVQEPSVSPVVSRLMALDIATTTPVQALVLLHELQQLAPTPHDRSVTSAAVAEQN